jgi:hypothetical protein
MTSQTNQFHVTLTSDSSILVYKNNSLSEFSVLLPESLQFNRDENWGVGLASIILPPVSTPSNLSATANSTSGELRSPLFIYLDIIETQFIGDGSTKVISVLPPAYVKSYYNFENPLFCPLSRHEIRHISVSIRDKFGHKYPFPPSIIPTTCTLTFKKL